MRPDARPVAFSLLAVTMAALAGTAVARAQTPTLPVDPVGPCPLSMLEPSAARAPGDARVGPVSPTIALTRSFQAGRWSDLEADVRAILSSFDAGRGLSPGCELPSPRPSSVVVAWIGRTALGDRALLSAVVPLEGGEPYASRLPGLVGPRAGLYQLFVTDGETDALAAGYVSAPAEDPLLAQVPEVADEVLGPMLALASRTTSRALRARAAAAAASQVAPGAASVPAAGWATLARVDLPHQRAKVKAQMRALAAPAAEGIAAASRALRDKLALVDVRYSPLAKGFASSVDALVQGRAGACAAAPETCLAQLDAAIRASYDAVCPCPDDDRKAVQLVDGRFRTLLLELEGRELATEISFQNTPLRRSSFGLLAGFSFARTWRHPNVKLDRGVYAHDGLARQLAMVTLNRSFVPYDEKALRVTPAERHRWFVGAVVTPAFGIGAGYSFLAVRGLGVDLGYAVLGTSRPAGGRTIGDTPADGDDPFALGWAGTWLFGVSYDFP